MFKKLLYTSMMVALGAGCSSSPDIEVQALYSGNIKYMDPCSMDCETGQALDRLNKLRNYEIIRTEDGYIAAFGEDRNETSMKNWFEDDRLIWRFEMDLRDSLKSSTYIHEEGSLRQFLRPKYSEENMTLEELIDEDDIMEYVSPTLFNQGDYAPERKETAATLVKYIENCHEKRDCL